MDILILKRVVRHTLSGGQYNTALYIQLDTAVGIMGFSA